MVHPYDPFLLGRSSGIQILECHSGKCGLHSPLCCLNWTNDPAAIPRDLETARNRTRSNQNNKGVSHYIDLLAGQLNFHNFGGVWSSIIMVQDPLMLQLRPLHSNTPLQLLQYPMVICRIDFPFLGDCMLINGSSTVKKKPSCAPSLLISASIPSFVMENRVTSSANFLVSILGQSNAPNFRRRLLHGRGNWKHLWLGLSSPDTLRRDQ